MARRGDAISEAEVRSRLKEHNIEMLSYSGSYCWLASKFECQFCRKAVYRMAKAVVDGGRVVCQSCASNDRSTFLVLARIGDLSREDVLADLPAAIALLEQRASGRGVAKLSRQIAREGAEWLRERYA